MENFDVGIVKGGNAYLGALTVMGDGGHVSSIMALDRSQNHRGPDDFLSLFEAEGVDGFL